MFTVVLCVVVGVCVTAVVVEMLSGSDQQPATAGPDSGSPWEPWRSLAVRAAATGAAGGRIVGRAVARGARLGARLFGLAADAVVRAGRQAWIGTRRGATVTTRALAAAAQRTATGTAVATGVATQAAVRGSRRAARGAAHGRVRLRSAATRRGQQAAAAAARGTAAARDGAKRSRTATSSAMARSLDRVDAARVGQAERRRQRRAARADARRARQAEAGRQVEAGGPATPPHAAAAEPGAAAMEPGADETVPGLRPFGGPRRRTGGPRPRGPAGRDDVRGPRRRERAPTPVGRAAQVRNMLGATDAVTGRGDLDDTAHGPAREAGAPGPAAPPTASTVTPPMPPTPSPDPTVVRPDAGPRPEPGVVGAGPGRVGGAPARGLRRPGSRRTGAGRTGDLPHRPSARGAGRQGTVAPPDADAWTGDDHDGRADDAPAPSERPGERWPDPYRSAPPESERRAAGADLWGPRPAAQQQERGAPGSRGPGAATAPAAGPRHRRPHGDVMPLPVPARTRALAALKLVALTAALGVAAFGAVVAILVGVVSALIG